MFAWRPVAILGGEGEVRRATDRYLSHIHTLAIGSSIVCGDGGQVTSRGVSRGCGAAGVACGWMRRGKGEEKGENPEKREEMMGQFTGNSYIMHCNGYL